MEHAVRNVGLKLSAPDPPDMGLESLACSGAREAPTALPSRHRTPVATIDPNRRGSGARARLETPRWWPNVPRGTLRNTSIVPPMNGNIDVYKKTH